MLPPTQGFSRLGGSAVYLGPEDIQLGKREEIRRVAPSPFGLSDDAQAPFALWLASPDRAWPRVLIHLVFSRCIPLIAQGRCSLPQPVQRCYYGPSLWPRGHARSSQEFHRASDQWSHGLQPPLPGVPRRRARQANPRAATTNGQRGGGTPVLSDPFQVHHAVSALAAPPAQILADIMTIREHFGRVENVKVRSTLQESSNSLISYSHLLVYPFFTVVVASVISPHPPLRFHHQRRVPRFRHVFLTDQLYRGWEQHCEQLAPTRLCALAQAVSRGKVALIPHAFHRGHYLFVVPGLS